MVRDDERARRDGDARDEVVTARELRDDEATRGTVTERHEATPPADPVRREPARPARDGGDRALELPEAYNLPRDRVRWGPIWAGLLAALGALLLLSVLGLALGLTVVDAGAAARGGAPAQAGWLPALWGALSALLAFLLGGYVAGWAAAVFDRKWGALNGALVFLLAVPATLLLAGLGLGALLGALGNFAGALNVDLGQLQGAAQAATGQAGQAAQQTQPRDAAQVAAGIRNGAWGTLVALLLGLGAAALGGLWGTRRELAAERATARVTNN